MSASHIRMLLADDVRDAVRVVILLSLIRCRREERCPTELREPMRFRLRLASAATAFAFAITLAQPSPAQTPEAALIVRGKVLYLRCASCHAIKAEAPAKTGPHLSGIVGSKAGRLPGYRYSKAMKAQTLIWNDTNLDRWLTAPSKVVPGTSMAFAGISKLDDRKALIAYLKKL